MSLPRSTDALKYFSALGVTCSIYLAVVTMILFLVGSPSKMVRSDNLEHMKPFILNESGLTGSFPFLIFAYMYQVNIPSIYEGLNQRSPERMSKVITNSTVFVVGFYVMVGFFGYALFA